MAARRSGACPSKFRVLDEWAAWCATALRAALDPGDHCGPWDQEERAGPGLPPANARGAQTPRDGRHGSYPAARRTYEQAFDSHKERKITT